MCIGATKTERADCGSPGIAVIRWPGFQGCIDKKRTVFKVNMSIGLREIDTGWYFFIFHDQGCLNKAYYTRSSGCMPPVTLDRSDRTELFFLCKMAVCICESFNFYWVTNRCCCSMCFNVSYCFRVNFGNR